MFRYPLHKISRFTEMNKNCPQCGLQFEVEPGFFFGAMYVSYAITVGLFIVIGVILFQLFEYPSIWLFATILPSTIIILLPLIFRYSRVLFLHLFGGVEYDDSYRD